MWLDVPEMGGNALIYAGFFPEYELNEQVYAGLCASCLFVAEI